PCALVRPRLSRDGVGARLDRWIPRTPSWGLAVGVVELGSGGGTTGDYIVGVVGHPYLATLLPLWLTMPSYTSPTLAVLAVRHASTGKGVDLTCVRSVVRPLGIRPYLCQVDSTTAGVPILASDQLLASGRPRRRASCSRARGCGGHVIICPIILPPREDLLEVPDEGAEDEVWCLAADSWWL
ncbi:hypothetical protein GW17_00047994, partial [Ensete ventricosum]